MEWFGAIWVRHAPRCVTLPGCAAVLQDTTRKVQSFPNRDLDWIGFFSAGRTIGFPMIGLISIAIDLFSIANGFISIAIGFSSVAIAFLNRDWCPYRGDGGFPLFS